MMRAVFALVCLAMLCMLVGMLTILTEARLDISTNVSGNGSMVLEGPGNVSMQGTGEQNVSLEFRANETEFERRI
jgi:hypothetical protein